ncbi:MAG: hypothetical protein WD226_08140 [Planctomycetota bacterium]
MSMRPSQVALAHRLRDGLVRGDVVTPDLFERTGLEPPGLVRG